MDQIMQKYDELYDEMVSSKDPRRMLAFGEAEKWIFKQLIVVHPELAEQWLVKIEAAQWHNFLSEKEAEEIVDLLEEKQGDSVVTRHEWDYEEWKSAIESIGGKVSDKPYYNCYALWAVMNMLYSDHASTINMFVQPPMRLKMYYHLALDKLMDADRPKFVRDYFHLKE